MQLPTWSDRVAKFSMTVAPYVEVGAVFGSGMAAIATALFARLRPGDALVFAEPLHGGT
jgi:methionine-gamma-lyase